MSLVYVHHFSISLDGFGTGEGQSRDAHFGHAGERLHTWMFNTRSWEPGGSGGVDDAFLQRHVGDAGTRSRRSCKSARSPSRSSHPSCCWPPGHWRWG